MVKQLPRLVLAALLALTAASTSTEAGFLITLERISDTQVRMTGTGSVGGAPALYDTLVFDAAGTGGGLGTAVGDFAIGGYGVTSLFASGGQLFPISSGTFNEMASPTGSTLLTVTSGGFVFKSVGSSGTLLGNIDGGNINDLRLVGRWEMLAAPIPEPSSLVLGGLGVVLVGFVAYRRRRVGDQS
jgi:hypothetical protein